MAYRVTFAMNLFNGPRDRVSSHKALNVLLAALTQIDIDYLKDNPRTPLLYQAGIRYIEEVPGSEDWRDIPTCLADRQADCEDLACWRSAEVFVRHRIRAVPIFGFRTLSNGTVVYHIRVQYPNGHIEDPSRILGMR